MGGTYLEIGCSPGTTLVNFHKTFHYAVAGIDFSNVSVTLDTLERYGVPGRVIEADFTTLKLEEQFDVVASFGFIEHFTNYEEIIHRQMELVKQGGYFIAEVPNLRYLNGLIYRVVDPALLEKHHLAVMDPNELTRVVRSTNQFEILRSDYYFSCFLFFDANNPVISRHAIVKSTVYFLRRVLRSLHLDEIPNRWMSPYIILIARKTISTTDAGVSTVKRSG